MRHGRCLTGGTAGLRFSYCFGHPGNVQGRGRAVCSLDRIPRERLAPRLAERPTSRLAARRRRARRVFAGSKPADRGPNSQLWPGWGRVPGVSPHHDPSVRARVARVRHGSLGFCRFAGMVRRTRSERPYLLRLSFVRPPTACLYKLSSGTMKCVLWPGFDGILLFAPSSITPAVTHPGGIRLAALRHGAQWCDDKLAGSDRFRYRLNGFDLEPLAS